MSKELGQLITQEREAADLTQRDLADRLNVNQSRVSRLEAGEGGQASSVFREALLAIGTERSRAVGQILDLTWVHLRQPGLTHPNLLELVDIERALATLSKATLSTDSSQELLGQAELLAARLREAGDFLHQTDHQVSYIGQIAVGKTTAVCKQTGLVLDPKRPNDLSAMMLDTGGGRTTLCDVVVRKGDRYSLTVEPLSDEEIYLLSNELCKSVYKVGQEPERQLSPADIRPPEEISRALRNMAGLTRPRRERGTNAPEPLVELAVGAKSLEELQAQFAARLDLWRRKRQEIEYDGTDDNSARQWFRNTFEDINNGRHPDFSLPARIVATVPFSPISHPILDVSVLDTRGIDGSSIRPDIIAHLKDQRTISVLCSNWGSAPDPAIQALMKHVMETEVDPSIFNRIVILVLARAADAFSMKHDSGERAQDKDEGYELKMRHVQDALHREQLPSVATVSFDAATDSGEDMSVFLLSQIQKVRNEQIVRARATAQAVDELVRNIERSDAIEQIKRISSQLKAFAVSHAQLGVEDVRTVPTRLNRAINDAHPRTIWASVRRKGTFWNFDFFQHLADGTAAILKRAKSQVFYDLRGAIEAQLSLPANSQTHGLLKQILANIQEWENDFIVAARHYTVATFRAELSSDGIWKECEDAYGSGAPYRRGVATRFSNWFEAHHELSKDLEFRLQLAWETSFIKPLLKAAGSSQG